MTHWRIRRLISRANRLYVSQASFACHHNDSAWDLSLIYCSLHELRQPGEFNARESNLLRRRLRQRLGYSESGRPDTDNGQDTDDDSGHFASPFPAEMVLRLPVRAHVGAPQRGEDDQRAPHALAATIPPRAARHEKSVEALIAV